MPTITVDGKPVFFSFRRGQGAFPCSLILIHGAGGSHLDWPPELRSMPGVDVYGVDLPGHGRSGPPACTSIADYAEVVTTLVERRSLQKVILIGHSMGGAIVQTIGLSPLKQIVGLVLIATGARLRVAPAILDEVTTDFEKTVDTITELAWSADASVELKRLGKQMLLSCAPATIHSDFLACNEFNCMDDLARIDLPTLVISGSNDRLTPLKYGQFLASSIPNSRLTTIEGAGHMVMLEKPQLVGSAIAEFTLALDGC
jgi:pimeloyl-ACP methyl ester carboxylesterase